MKNFTCFECGSQVFRRRGRMERIVDWSRCDEFGWPYVGPPSWPYVMYEFACADCEHRVSDYVAREMEDCIRKESLK